MDSLDKDAILRQAIFVKPSNKDELHRWIKVFLGLDMPNYIICDDEIRHPPSNSCPMDLIWEIYDKCEKGDDPNFSQVLGFSAREGGKCVEKGTKLLTQNGLISIENAKIGDVIWSGKSWQPIENWIHDGIKESVKVVLKNSLNLTVSPIHKVWSWETGKTPNWKKVSELTDDDLVCVDTSFNNLNQILNQDEYDLGYLLGILQGDGCLTIMDTYNRVILSTNDNYVLEFFKKQCLKYTNRLPSNRKNKPYDWFINSKDFCIKLKEFGLKSCYSWEKEVPDLIYSSTSYMKGFISGLLDTDGSVCKRNRIELEMTASKLLNGVQIILQSLGIDCSISHKTRLYGLQKHLVSKLTIYKNDTHKVFESGISIKAKKANAFIRDFNINVSSFDVIPKGHLKLLLDNLPTRRSHCVGGKPTIYSKSLSRRKVNDLLQWAETNNLIKDIEYWKDILKNKWVKIKSIDKGEADFYDLTVKEDHSYWSNGLISHNTLSAAVLETLCMIHLNRDVVHVAALEVQAKNCQSYVEKFLKRPILREMLTSKNKRDLAVTRYRNDDGDLITPVQWAALTPFEQSQWEAIVNKMQIVICTPEGANGLHAPFMVCDELDLADPQGVEEAKMIPVEHKEPGQPAKLPLTFFTSTRKYSFGQVQKEIDNADKTGLQIRHWNIIDVTEACPPTRHLPEEPKINIYYEQNTLKAISEADFNVLNDKEKEQYDVKEGYSGCLKNCKLFASCLGRLATKQKSKSSLLKSIYHTQSIISKVSIDTAKCQYLCFKPSSEGLIYPHFYKESHMLTAAQMANRITGDDYDKNFGKIQLIELMQSLGAEFYCGLDWGFTHKFAVVTAALLGHILYIIDVISITGLEDQEKAQLCKEKLKYLKPTIYPDNAYPQSVKTFRRAGFKMVDFKKEILTGIEAARLRIAPGIGKLPSLYLLKDDPGCELLGNKIMQYHWKLDPKTGKLTDEPDKDNDDELDAMRYLCQNVPVTKQKIVASFGLEEPKALYKEDPNKNWMKRKVSELIDGNDEGIEITGKSNGIIFKI